MGIFSKIRGKAEGAIDAAIDPARELEMAILELEDGRKKALAELISYKTTARQMEQELDRLRARATEWEARAMRAVKSGDDDAAKQALREQKSALIEIVKIERDRNEAAGYAVQLNRSRKEFETRLTMLKMRKHTLATQLAAARGKGGLLGSHDELWDRFKAAEDRIDQNSIDLEVDAALDARLLAAAGAPVAELTAGDPLAQLKAQMATTRAAAAAGPDVPAKPDGDA